MRGGKFTRNEEWENNTSKAKGRPSDDSSKRGKIFVVGIGPGDLAHMTLRAKSVWGEVEYVAGYKTYVDLIRPLLEGQRILATGMRQEIDRCQEVVRLAGEGAKIALVSSGDAGIYGMAGILIECMEQSGLIDIPLEIIPGVTAANASAAMLGAPLMHDFAVISLSDLLTPWDVIKKRVEFAAQADFILALYNPKSLGRVSQIEAVREILIKYKPLTTPVGLVREALRGDNSSAVITNLEEFTKHEIDMLTTVLIGNSQTRKIGPYMVTPRGYVL